MTLRSYSPEFYHRIKSLIRYVVVKKRKKPTSCQDNRDSNMHVYAFATNTSAICIILIKKIISF